MDILTTYDRMITDKASQFAIEFDNRRLNPFDFNLKFLRYGTIESICEELGEVIQADKELKNLDLMDKDHNQNKLVEELGDLIFNISLFAAYRGINLDTLLGENLLKIAKRG